MTIDRKYSKIALIALLAWGSLLECAAGQSSDPLLTKRIAEFEYHGFPSSRERAHISVADTGGTSSAALSLANHAGLRISVEELPPSVNEPVAPIEVEIHQSSVGEVLQEIVRQDPRYTFRERLGVIEVLPIGADQDPKSCLNIVIPEFRVHYNFNDAWSNVTCEVGILKGEIKAFGPDPIGESDPISGGVCSGRGSHLAHPPPQLIQAMFRETPLRDILDQLVSSAGNVSWTASWNGTSRSCRNLRLGVYQPIGWYPKDPDSVGTPKPEGYIEGLPSKCTSCHYHEDQKR